MVRINGTSMEALFDLYSRSGFLHDKKRAWLEPHMAAVRETWRRLLAANDTSISACFTSTDRRSHEIEGTVMMYRAGGTAWHSQHLAALRGRGAAFEVLAAASRWIQRDEAHETNRFQTPWFSEKNPVANRLFGDFVRLPSPGRAFIEWWYCRVGDDHRWDRGTELLSVESAVPSSGTLGGLQRAAPPLYIATRALRPTAGEESDIRGLFLRHGLDNHVERLFVRVPGAGEPVAMVSLHSSSPGLNLSFLSNRVEVLVDPEADVVTRRRVVATAIELARAQRQRYPTDSVLLTLDPKTWAASMAVLGPDSLLRVYTEAIFARTEYAAFEDHVHAVMGTRPGREGRSRAVAGSV